MKQCINHGQPHKKFMYPDGWCGKSFVVGEDSACAIHPGVFMRKRRDDKNGTWSCCEAEGREAAPCQEGEHATAEWPDEEAKKYFFDKPLKNAADKYKFVLSKDVIPSDFELYGNKCGVWREAVPYVEANPSRGPDIPADEQRKLDATDRQCMNYACENKVFK